MWLRLRCKGSAGVGVRALVQRVQMAGIHQLLACPGHDLVNAVRELKESNRSPEARRRLRLVG